jgi:hypothetical protein
MPSGENIKHTHRSLDVKGLFWRIRVSSPRINMLESSDMKRDRFVRALG